MLIPLNKDISIKLEKSIQHIENLLAKEQYEKVTKYTKNNLSEDYLRKTVSQFGERVTKAPSYLFSNFCVFPLKDLSKKNFHIDYDLWIDGKVSSLTLQMNVNLEGENPIIEVEDLHIM